jgi:hypothetical protein
MKKKLPFVAGMLVAVVAVGTSVVATDALACGFIDYREVRQIAPKKVIPPSDLVSAAEQQLEDEHPVEAAALVAQAFPQIRRSGVGASPLQTHALRLVALATVRSLGSLRGVSGFSASSPAERTRNLAWAAATLRAISASRPGDPVANADLGEALAASPTTEEEAFGLLDDLSRRDLIGSAHAYAALARLISQKTGDAVRVHAAVARCEVMSKAPAVVCRAPEAPVAIR